jgi:hypothetical protein
MTRAKQRRSLEEAIVDTVREPLVVLDDALRVVVASRLSLSETLYAWTPRNTIFADGLRASAAARVAAQTGSDRWLSRGMPKSVDFMSRQCGSALEPRQSGEVVGQVGERDFGGCARLTDGPDDQV